MKCILVLMCLFFCIGQNIILSASVPSDNADMKYRADSLKSMKSYNEALLLYDSLLIEEPSDIDIMISKGICQSQIGEINKALETFKTVKDIDSTSPLLWKSIGHAYLFANLPQSAIIS